MNILMIIMAIITCQYLLELIDFKLADSQSKKQLPASLQKEIEPSKWSVHQHYLRKNRRLSLIQSTVDWGIYLAVIGSPLFMWLSQHLPAQTLTWEYIQFIVLIGLTKSILSIPFHAYKVFNIEQRFGFNNTTLKIYLLDKLKQFSLSIILGVPILYILIRILSEISNAWIWASLFLVILQFIFMLITPTWIFPIFNSFTPIKNDDLINAIQNLSLKTNYPINTIMQMDGSKRSNKANAFFIGLGKTKRVVLYDTLISMFKTPSIMAVIAHEIGHYKHHHIFKLWMINSVTICMMFIGLNIAIKSSQLSQIFGFSDAYLPVNIIVFSILFHPISTLIGIATHAVSRHFEYQADQYAVKFTSKKDLSHALIQLHKDNLADLNPHPFHVWLYYSHPPLAQRIRAINADC